MPLVAVTRPLFLTAEEFEDYGGVAPAHPNVMFAPVDLATVKVVNVVDLWFEEPLTKEWMVAYRLAFQAHGVVIAEIRIFPSGGRRLQARRLDPSDVARRRVVTDGDAITGRWIGELLGYQAPVPAGGIKAQSVLRQIRLRRFERNLATLFKQKNAPYTVASLERERLALATNRRGPKIDLRRLALIAKTYDAAYTQGLASPTRAVADAFHLTPGAAAAAVARARRLGMLTGTTKGRRGGLMTQYAREFLASTPAHTSKGRQTQ